MAGSSGVDWLLLLPTALLLITVLLLTRSIARMIRLLRLLARCNNHDRRASDIAAREAAKMQLRREPTVALVSARMTPLLLVRRAGRRSCSPAALVEQLDDEQLACVIRHELAHFVRRDHCANAIAFVVASLFWWNPVAWWARREMRLAQEACCDAIGGRIGSAVAPLLCGNAASCHRLPGRATLAVATSCRRLRRSPLIEKEI